jgi:hypothetical protein
MYDLWFAEESVLDIVDLYSWGDMSIRGLLLRWASAIKSN